MWFSALWCCGSVVVAVPYPGLGPLGLRPPSPFGLGFACFFCVSVWPVARHLSPGVCAGVSGVPFPPALRWPCGCRGPLLLAWCRRDWAGWSPGVLSGGPVGVAFGVAWLGGVPSSFGVDARLRGCVTVSPFFLLSRWSADARSWPGGGSPHSVSFFGRGFTSSSLCLPWAVARTRWHSVWLIGLLWEFWVAAGRALAPWVGWVMYTLGLVACSVGLGAGSAGWAVAPAIFVRSWVRGGGVILCPPAPAVPGSTFWWQFVRAGRRCRGGGVTDRRVVAPRPCVAGLCGVVPRLWAHFLPFQVVRRLARVRPTVSVPRFGAVVCYGAPCCVVLCFAVLSRAVLCCAAVRSALSCRAARCRAVVCLAVAWPAALCCAAPHCVLLCCVISRRALSRRAARRCAVLQGAVLPRVVPCLAVRWCVVGPLYLCFGVGWRGPWLDWSVLLCVTRAEVMWLAGGRGARLDVAWLVGSVLRGSGCAVRLGGSGGCPRGCPPWGPVPWSRVFWGSLLLGVCRVLWGGVLWSPRGCWVPYCPVPLPPCGPPSWVSRPYCLLPLVPGPLRLCGGPCCGRVRRLAVRVWWWAVRCSQRVPVWV